MSLLACPRCGNQDNQTKAGNNRGKQQYRCAVCGRRYVMEHNERGFGETVKEEAVRLRTAGHTLREIGAYLGLSTRTLTKWFRDTSLESAHAAEPEPDLEPTTDEADAPMAAVTTRRRATIHDVAERAGVAVSTVSNFLNNKTVIAAVTRERIQKAVDELHFTPNGLMRAVRQGRTRILGLLNFGFGFDAQGNISDHGVAPPILFGIERETDATKHDLLVYTSRWSQDLSVTLPFLDGYIDGLLFVGPEFKDPILERVAAAGLPVVALLSRHVPPNAGYVNTDNIGAMYKVVEHLVSIGRRRIGCIAPIHNSNFLDRYNGLRAALATLIPDSESSMVKAVSRDLASPWETYMKSVETAYRNMLESADRLDAIVTMDDGWGRWTQTALRERGFRVPEDIVVVGFDDVRSTEAAGLTTIRQPFPEIGKTAVKTLVAMIEGAPVSECRISLPGELIVRSSTLSTSSASK